MAADSPFTEPQLVTAMDSAVSIGDMDTAKSIAQQIQDQRVKFQPKGLLRGPGDAGPGLPGTYDKEGKYVPETAHGTFATELASSATLGGTKYLSALVRSYAHSKPFREALTDVETEMEADYQANPTASWAGFGGGMVVGGGLLNAAGKAIAKPLAKVGAGALNPLVIEKGAGAGNVAAKLGATGAAIAGTQAAVEGKDVGEAAALGAATGAVAGGAASKLAKALEPVSYKVAAMMEGIRERFSGAAWRQIAKTTGENLDDIANAAAAFKAQSGRDATLADIVQWSKRGELKGLAERSPTVANALREQQVADNLRNPQTLQQTIEKVNGGAVASEESLALGRRSAMDRRMGQIRDNPVEVSQDELNQMLDNRILRSLRRGVTEDEIGMTGGVGTLQQRLDAAMQDAATNGRTRLTLGDVDAIRQEARKLQGSLAKDHPVLADEFGELGDRVAGIGARVPGYREALIEYGVNSRKLEGHKFGSGLKARSEIDKAFVSDRMRSPEGTEGYRSGLLSGLYRDSGDVNGATSVAKKLVSDLNLRRNLGEVLSPDEVQQLVAHSQHILQNVETRAAVTPRGVTADVGGSGTTGAHAIGVAGSAIHGSATGLGFHIGKVLSSMRLKMSEGVQKRVAEYLTDPKMVDKGVAILKRAGATNEQVKSILRAGATAQGATLGSAFASEQE